MKKRIFALMLALCMMTACTAGAETVKRERVFAVVSPSGEVQTLLDSVRLENGDALDEITDRTMLKDIENVGGQQPFALEGEALTWQAEGGSITYQGTADKALDVTPVVTVTLNGKEATLDDVRSGSGDMVLTVRYEMAVEAPYLAVSVLPLDGDYISDVTVDNGTIVTGDQGGLLVGWAIPGADEGLGLPDSFTMMARVDHPDLTWMMTAATAQPLEALCDEAADDVDDLRAAVKEMADGLTALRDGEELSAGEGELHDGMEALLTLFDGVTALRDGAAALESGAASLDEGAASLETGLATLTANNEVLNQGAAQLFASVLDVANAQLAAAGLEAAGVTLPALTAENYAAVLQAAMDQLDPEALTAMAAEAAREQVRAQVMQQEGAVREAVTQAVEAQVLEKVLAAAGMPMAAQDYAAAAEAGQVEGTQAQQISAAVEQMMATDEVKAMLEAAVQAQIDQLVEDNVASEAVQRQIAESIAQAETAREALSALKGQLDTVAAFVTGLGDYTDGVAQAAAGATALHTGSTQLSEGAVQLKDGTAALADGLDSMKGMLTGDVLNLLTGDVQAALDAFDATRAQLDGGRSYDLVAEGMAHSLLFLIRTDMTK